MRFNRSLILAITSICVLSLDAGAQTRITVPGETVTVDGGQAPQVPLESVPINGTLSEIPTQPMPVPAQSFTNSSGVTVRILPTVITKPGDKNPIRSEQCTDAIKEARRNCDAGGLTSVAASVMQSAARAAPQNLSDAYAACKSMQLQATVAAGGSAMVGTICIKSARSCERTCNDYYNKGFGLDQRGADTCKSYEHNGEIGLVGGLGTSMAGFIQASSCEKIIAAANSGCPPGNTTCAKFCQSAPQFCQPENCMNGANASNPYCQAMNSINMNALAETGLPGGGADGAGTFDENGQGFQGYKSNNNSQASAGNDAPPGGGGYAGGASSSYPGGKDGSGAARAQTSYNSDVDHGYSGGGGGWPTAASNQNTGGRGGRGGDNVDLSQYLPGGELDPRRGIASADDLRSKGITGPNDLSNFEKITRMMNKKRPYLQPGSN